MTDPSNERAGDDEARDASSDAPDDADVTEAADDPDAEPVETADDDAADVESESAADDEPADDGVPAKKKPAATGKASRSGNPARAAEAEDGGRRTRPVKPQRIGNRWAAPAMLTSAAIGLIWIVLYYVFANQDNPIPVMSDLGDWNLIIGMGFIVAAFGFSMKWE